MNSINFEKQAGEIGISLESLLELYEIFAEQTEQDIKELQTYINDLDFFKVNSCAHHIKGACLNMELDSMVELAVEMQSQSEKGNKDTLLDLLEQFSTLFEQLKIVLSGTENG